MIRGAVMALVLLCSAWAGASSASAVAASNTARYTGGGWTLTLTFQKTAYGQVMQGWFYSARHRYTVHGDWIPAADQGSDLLRFYGRPFGPTSPVGLVGVATLANTCVPSCVASRHYKLVEVSPSPMLSRRLPGVGKASLQLRLAA